MPTKKTEQVEGEVVEEPTNEPEEGQEEEEEAPDVESLQDENSALRALLGHFAEGVNVDQAMDDIAYKRDGTPVYIGKDAKSDRSDSEDQEGKESKEGKAGKAAPRRPRQPAEQRRNTPRQKEDASAIVEQARAMNSGR